MLMCLRIFNFFINERMYFLAHIIGAYHKFVTMFQCLHAFRILQVIKNSFQVRHYVVVTGKKAVVSINKTCFTIGVSGTDKTVLNNAVIGSFFYKANFCMNLQ